jgi:hypothetical protein
MVLAAALQRRAVGSGGLGLLSGPKSIRLPAELAEYIRSMPLKEREDLVRAMRKSPPHAAGEATSKNIGGEGD